HRRLKRTFGAEDHQQGVAPRSRPENQVIERGEGKEANQRSIQEEKWPHRTSFCPFSDPQFPAHYSHSLHFRKAPLSLSFQYCRAYNSDALLDRNPLSSAGCTLRRIIMATMRVVQVPRPKGPFELVERKIPEPGAGAVRVRVQACGICHSDALTKDGLYPGLEFPRVPGHE